MRSSVSSCMTLEGEGVGLLSSGETLGMTSIHLVFPLGGQSSAVRRGCRRVVRGGGGCWIMQTQWAKANIRSETKDSLLRSQGGQLFPLSGGSDLN